MRREYILQMGYFPDRFATHDLPPDTFFIHVVDGDEDAESGVRARHVSLAQAVDDLVSACKDKYKLDRDAVWSDAFRWADTFWTVSVKPDA